MINAYYWWWPMMAEVAAAGSGLSPEAVGTIILTLISGLIGGGRRSNRNSQTPAIRWDFGW